MIKRRCDIFRGIGRLTGNKARAVRVRYLKWQNTHLSESVELIFIALLLGVFAGMAAAALKGLVGLLNDSILAGVHIGKPNVRFLIWPLAGILVTGIYQRYVVRGNVSRGTRIIRSDLDSGHYRLSPFTIFNPIVGCSLTMGFGATGGTEGPTALSGAAIGSVIGRWFGLSRAWLRLLVGIGAGAGISAIFKSPTGGVLFTLEVLQMELTTLPVLALVIACLFASTTAYLLSDFTFDIFFDKSLPLDPHTLGWVAMLGIFCGLYSIYYSYTKNKATAFFTSIRRPWVASLVTGTSLSVFVFMFPILFGEGFNVITSLVNGVGVSFTESGILAGHSGPLWMLAGIVAVLLLKGALGGGVAGDFVPTFFAGALAGYLFATVINLSFGLHLPVWLFSLVGMGAVMAGTIHAPLMAIFILCETTNTYGYVFPYLIAVAVAYATVKILTPRSWYGEADHDDLMALLSRKDTPSFRANISDKMK